MNKKIDIVSPRDPVPVYTGLLERVYQLSRYLGEDNDVTVIYPYERGRKASESGRIPDEQPFERLGIESQVIDILESRISESSPLRFPYQLHLWLYPQLRRRFREYRPDVVVVEFPYLMPLARAAARGLGCTFILSEHNVEYRFVQRMGTPFWRGLKWYEMRACNAADAVVFVSETDRDSVAPDLQGPAVRVAPNGVDVSRYTPENRARAERIRNIHDLDGPVFIYHGNLGATQNAEAVSVLLKTVFPAIRSALPEASLLLVGADPPETSQSNVVCTGLVDDLPGYLAAADVAVIPLKTGSGTKLKVLEYLASGVPVVTTPVGAEGIALEHEVSALIEEDPHELAAEAVRLAGDESLRERLRTAGRELAVENYSWDSTLEPYGELLESFVYESDHR
jgi:glycosyltransferase involved in cell wall biosynthesis